MGGSQWRIETEFETEKSDVGLDEYETLTWAGWHHHVAICLVAGAFLLSLQQASTTVALLNPAVTAVAGSGIAVPVPDGAVSTETITEQAQWDDSRSIPGG